MGNAVFDGITKKMTSRHSLNSRGDIRQDQYGNMTVTQGMPSLTELAHAGKIYTANISGGTALAPVAAMPTTAAAVGLYNAGSGNTKLVILAAWAQQQSGTSGLGGSLIGCIPNAAQGTALADYSGVTKGGLNPGQATTVATLKDAVTLAAAPSWTPLALDNMAAAINVGGGFFAPNLQGMFIVPPLYVFGLHILAPLGTTALFDFGVMWAEIAIED